MAKIEQYQITQLAFAIENLSISPEGDYFKDEEDGFIALYYSIVRHALEIPQDTEITTFLKSKIDVLAKGFMDNRERYSHSDNYTHYKQEIRDHFTRNYPGIEFDSKKHLTKAKASKAGLLVTICENPNLLMPLSGAALIAMAFLGVCEYISPALTLTGLFGGAGAFTMFASYQCAAEMQKNQLEHFSALSSEDPSEEWKAKFS